MRIVATIPARNEAWCLEPCIRSALKWCDDVIVLDHASTDDTPEILDRLPVYRLHEPDPIWREAAYRQRLLNTARSIGATHVVTIDADEFLTDNAVPLIRWKLAQLKAGEVLRVPWLMLWGSLDRYRAGDASVWSTATAPLGFRVCEREYTTASYDIHHRVPAGLTAYEAWRYRCAGLMHLQHVSKRRLRAKQALYKINERLRWGTPVEEIEARYGRTTDETGMKLEPAPVAWGTPQVNADAEPWQEGEVNRLLALHGREPFKGLDLLGYA